MIALVIPLAFGLGDVLDKAMAFVTVAAFGALFLIYGTTKTLRDTNNDLRAQHEDDKERLALRDAEIAELKKLQAEMAGRIAVLEGLVTGAVNWQAISDQLKVLTEQVTRDEVVLNKIHRDVTTLTSRDAT